MAVRGRHLVLGSLLVTVAFVWWTTTQEEPAPEPPPEYNPPDPKGAARAATTLEMIDWYAGGFENVMVASFKATNKGDVPVKDLEITCGLYGPSGTLIGYTTHTIYEIVPPGETRQFSKVNMGFINSQSKRASCWISDLAL